MNIKEMAKWAEKSPWPLRRDQAGGLIALIVDAGT